MSKIQANNTGTERRCFSSEVRAVKQEDKTIVRGYAAKFDTLSENLGGFREMIAPGAFDSVLTDDVRALMNHDNNFVLGRTKAGTLRMGVDEVGLWYEYDDPNTSYSRDLLISMERGDVDQSSFQFSVEDDEWKEDEEQRYVRTIKKVRRLYDVSPVTFPAYVDTTVAKRSLEQIQQETKPDTSWQRSVNAFNNRLRILNPTKPNNIK
jgi:uncharacterized protein